MNVTELAPRIRSVEVDNAPLEPRAVRARRALDIALVVLSAPLWLPAAAGTGAAVALSSGRPVLFCQQRSGRDGDPFTMLKFRSMKTGPNPLIPTDDRMTKIGGFLRRTSLDELPQLFNVLEGSMSLVGPRPMLPEQDANLSPEHHVRRMVRPGLTGLAQVSGRNTLRWRERLELDGEWVHDASLRSYVRVLWRTIGVVLGREGVDGHCATDPFVDVVHTTPQPEVPRKAA